MAGKLGKLAAELSDKDLQFKSILKAVAIPAAYDFDATHPNLVYPMYANDELGDCVLAGRAHQTLRFELLEQSRILPISDEDVKAEYFLETGGVDSGLVVSRSLRRWRQWGWIAAGARYFAKAYSRIDYRRIQEVKSAIYADVGVGIGMALPNSAIDQFDAGKPWEVVSNDGGIAGGHYVYLPAYDPAGFTCVTWGQRQHMSEKFFSKYVDEAWMIIDAKNPTSKQHDLIDFAKLNEFLKSLKHD